MKKYLIIKKTKELSFDQINEIMLLKNQHWKNGLKSQLIWFKNNSFANDIHIMVYINNKVIGYVHLGYRRVKINLKEKNYILFRNLIVNKKFRSQKISSLIMNVTNILIRSKKEIGFLICKKKLCKFYQKFNWKINNKKLIFLSDHDHRSMKFMIFNSKSKFKKIFFYKK